MRNLLIVDPSIEKLEGVKKIVRDAEPDVTVSGADSEEKALATLASTKLDLLILSDIPHNSDSLSWTTLESLRAKDKHLPILLILQPEHEALASEAMKHGASDIVIRSAAFEVMLPIAIRRTASIGALKKSLKQHRCELQTCREEQRAKREFLSAITHELRTPLVGMRIYTQFLASGRLGPLAPIQKEKIEAIYRNTERLTHCIEGIQRYQRLEQPQIELLPVDFDLRAVLGEAIGAVMPACMEKGISLGQSWPPDPVKVHADRDLIVEVVKDLLDNAVKFTAAKGSISVNVVETPERRIMISILDSGCGMSKDALAHAFEPCGCLAEKKQPSSGLGLGLRTVKRILDAHHSALQIDSEENSGTRVRFTLPPAQAMAGTPHITDSTRILRRRTVLVVDDDEDNLCCTRSVLEYGGYEVLSASSFREAKAQLDEGHVDAVLLDVAMRGADGLETLHSLKRSAATSSLPVVMVSAKADDEVRVKAARMGAAGFVVKPFVPAKLLRELDVVLETATV